MEPEQFYYKCGQCFEMFPIEKLKYHTPESFGEVIVFCSPECSLEHYKYNNEWHILNKS